MSPVPNSVNPAATSNQRAIIHRFTINLVSKKTQTWKLGYLVYATSWAPTPTSETGTFAPPRCSIATTTASGLLLGVCVGSNTQGTIPPKQTGTHPYSNVMIVVMGYAGTLYGATTTLGHFAVVSTATAGLAKDAATPTAGKTLGVVLQAKTISSGTAIVMTNVLRM